MCQICVNSEKFKPPPISMICNCSSALLVGHMPHVFHKNGFGTRSVEKLTCESTSCMLRVSNRHRRASHTKHQIHVSNNRTYLEPANVHRLRFEIAEGVPASVFYARGNGRLARLTSLADRYKLRSL